MYRPRCPLTTTAISLLASGFYETYGRCPFRAFSTPYTVYESSNPTLQMLSAISSSGPPSKPDREILHVLDLLRDGLCHSLLGECSSFMLVIETLLPVVTPRNEYPPSCI